MEARRLAALLSHLSPSSHPHRPKKPENRHGHGAVLATSDRHENWRVYIENDSEDVISLKLQDASSNECRVEEIEEASQTSTCIQKRTTNDTTTSGSEIGFVTTMEDKQEIESESSQTGSKDLRRIDLTARNTAIVSRNNAMTGEKIGFVEDCIFCLIVQGRSPAFKLYEDEMCICILDVHPLTDGHSLIIPKVHFHSLEFTPPEVAAAMCATVPFISMAIMEATSSDSFNLIVNSGKAAGQVVFHTHFHIIPRKSGDNLWRSESVCRPMLCVGHETSQLVRQIRHNLSGKGS